MILITADRIHDGNGWLPQGTTLSLAADGTVTDILATPPAGTIHYNGVLCPGFVNAHCHLELSHMHRVIPEGTGLIQFLSTVPLSRNNFSDEDKEAARNAALQAMNNNGIVAVGDIANTADTLALRATGSIHFHTFVEALGFVPAGAARSMSWATGVYEQFAQQPQGSTVCRQSITPHAPYSVSAPLFRLIDEHNASGIISIHNQESEEENRFYTDGTGGVNELLATLGIPAQGFEPTGMRSLPSYMQWLSPGHRFMLVHNTWSGIEDVQFAHSYAPDVYWCLCPNANLYIEGSLPDIDMLIAEGARICVGTDSLASNHKLSVLSELATIRRHFPHLGWDTLLTWGTHNGATALNMDSYVGSIAPGKKPGILHLTGLDSNDEEPAVKRII